MQPKALLLSSDLIDAGSRMCSLCLVYWYHAVATVMPIRNDPLRAHAPCAALRAHRWKCASSPLGAGGHLSPPGWLKSGLFLLSCVRTDGPCADRPTGGEARPSKVLGGHRAGRITPATTPCSPCTLASLFPVPPSLHAEELVCFIWGRRRGRVRNAAQHPSHLIALFDRLVCFSRFPRWGGGMAILYECWVARYLP